MKIRELALGFAVVAIAACSTRSSTPSASVNDKLAGSQRLERNGWIYVHLEGTPDRLGYQHGYLLANEIGDLLNVVGPMLQHTSSRDWAFYRQAAEQMLWPKMDAEYQTEIDGIVAGATAKGVKLDRWDIVALNAMEELPGYYVPWLDKSRGKTPTTHAPGNCSAFAATGSYTKDHQIVMGHNAWTDYVVGPRWNIIFDLVPSSGPRRLMDGLPGVIVSDDDLGVSSTGMIVTETTISQFEGFDPSGVPEFMRARKALQYAVSIDDYVRIMLDGNNGGYANDWLVGDNKTGEVALFELGLKQHSLRRTTDGYFVGSNFPVDDKLIKAETTFDPAKKDSSANARHTRWNDVMSAHKGQIDVELAKTFETDKYDVIDKRDGPTERSLCGAVETSARGIPEWDWGKFFPGGTVQAKVIDSAMADRLTFWASTGHQCAPDFIAADFVKLHPEYGWANGLLHDLKSQPWTQFTSGMK